jgi:hypothetical protein
MDVLVMALGCTNVANYVTYRSRFMQGHCLNLI